MSMTKAFVQKRIHGLDEETSKNVVCALVGHSHVVHLCLGEVTCARCGDRIGDTWLSSADLSGAVVVGHSCETCATNYARMGWRDKFMTPDPEIVMPEGGWPAPEPVKLGRYDDILEAAGL